ncbi:MAG: heme ABC exporter ATP-binding protein CcmA [Candidatus Dormiibacterota bacterium]
MREVDARKVGARIDSQVILEGVDLRVESGEMVAVTGPSGSGKTTLLMLLAGLQTPQSGEVRVDGQPIARLARARQRIGIILQNHGLVAILTAEENVALPLQVREMGPAETEQHTKEALLAVGLEESSDHLVQDLSGGQQQRVGVARALAGDPELLIADEPTSELAANDRVRVLALLREQAGKGGIVVIASHDQDVVLACDRSLRLVDGRVSPG